MNTSTTQGHCSLCHKVWNQPEQQGVCQWCGKPASCQTAARPPRRSSSSRKQPKISQGNGYDQLAGAYLTYYNVASRFAKGVPAQDAGDLLHTIISNLADADRSNGHKPDNLSWMYRMASFSKAQYWRDHYKITNGLTCCSCSKAQRRKCKVNDLYSQCPKAIKLESLNKPVIDNEGNLTELGDLIVDDRTIDIPQWYEINEQLLHSPDRLILIGEKILTGETLTHAERVYLSKMRKREQKNLF